MKSNWRKTLYTAIFVAGCAISFPNDSRAAQGGYSPPQSADENGRVAPEADPKVVVTSVTLGSHVDSRLAVPVPKALFKPNDNISLSVSTYAPGTDPISATLGALWTYGTGPNRQAVNDDSVEIETSGEERTAFHLTNSRDWPEGQYHVEVFVNGLSVHKLEFVVR